MPSALLPSAIATVVLLCGAPAHAQCMMDAECEGDRICESGSCVDPSPAAPPLAPVPTPTTTAPANAKPRSSAPSPLEQPPPPRLVPHSELMVGAGVFSVVLGGAAFLGGMGYVISRVGCGGFGNVGSLGSSGCDTNGGFIGGALLSALVLTSGGVTLIVVGNRKRPASLEHSMTLSPRVGRHSAGLSLRFDL